MIAGCLVSGRWRFGIQRTWAVLWPLSLWHWVRNVKADGNSIGVRVCTAIP